MKRNTKCRVEAPTVTADPVYGGTVTTWEPIANPVRWCEVVDKMPSTDERNMSGLPLSTIRTRVRMNYCTDIDATMRFVIMRPSETIWTITGGPAEIGNKKRVEFMAERKSS